MHPIPSRAAVGYICDSMFRLALLLVLLFAAPVVGAAPLAVEGVRVGVHPDKTRVVLDLSAPAQFEAFALTGPDRVVVDLPPAQWRGGGVARPPGAAVVSLRHGVRATDGGMRLVLEMAAPTSVASAFVLPAQGGKPDRLVLDLVAQAVPAGTEIRAVPPPKPAPPPQKTQKKRVVVIDAGHGGRDPGAVSRRVREKDITLALSKELARQLRASGRYTVHLTRESDHIIALHERVEIARRYGADLFVSIHADSIGRAKVRGASVYTLSETASDKQTAKLAVKENQVDIIAGLDLSTQDPQVTSILIDLAQRDAMNKAGFVAETLVDTFKDQGVRTLENPHRYAGFAVLKAPDVPSILIEAGFLSNRAEAKLLSQPGHRKTIARAIKKGIDAYFDRLNQAQHP